MKTGTQWIQTSIRIILFWGLFIKSRDSLVCANKLMKNARGWKGLVEIADDTIFNGTTFASLPVVNSQQCLRLCWLYKACTLLSYDTLKGTCHLTSLDAPDMTSYYRKEKNIVTVDMRLADVDEPKPRGCDKRPCDEDHLCVPVVRTSSYRCLSTVLKFCPSPPPRVFNSLDMNDGVNSVTYRCQDGYVKSGTTDVSTCDRASGQWSAVDVTCTYVECGMAPDVINALKEGSHSFFNAGVTYTCLEGHVTSSTSMTIVCQDNSQWTTPPSDCLHVVCPDPVRLTNANVHLVERDVVNTPLDLSGELLARSYGGQAIHFCDRGFTSAVGNFTSVCQSGGTWTTSSSFNCSAVDCGQPPTMLNAWSFFNSSFYQSQVEYLCQEGYRNNTADMRLQCGAIGRWEGPEVLCSPVDCGTPPEVFSALASYNDTVFGSQVVYTCNSPSIPFSNASRGISTCQADGHWASDTSVECVRCGAPPDVGNASYWIHQHPKGPEVKLYVARYACEDGFITRNGFVMYCNTLSEKWQGKVPYCEPAVCSQPVDVENAKTTYTDTSYNSVVIYQCHEGYRYTNGFTNLTCSKNAIWESSGPQRTPIKCTPVKCYDPPEVSNADFLVSEFSFGYNGTVIYKCLDGTVMTSPSNTIRCTENGWDTSAPVRCEYVSCGNPPEVANSDQVIDTSVAPIKVTYTCHEGFHHQLPGADSQTCTDTTWTVNEVSCVAMDCEEPQTIEGATVTYNRTVYGSVATYWCKGDLVADGANYSWSLNTTCQADGMWSPSSDVLNCEPPDCGTPPTKPNTSVLYESTVLGSVASYTCIEGFHFGSFVNFSLTCSVDGKWNGEDWNCTKIDCGVPPDITSTKLSYNSTTFKSEVIYSCIEDDVETGSALKTCSATGNWTGDDIFECISVKCQEAPRVDNALVTYDANRTIGSAAVYTCANGYQLAWNISNITCLGNGEWSSEHVECVQMNCSGVPLVQNAVWVLYNVDQYLVAEYSCREGYKAIDDLNERTCFINEGGNWSTNFIECVPDHELPCPEPETVRNASFKLTSRRPGAQVIYTCDAGYGHWWFESRQCTENGIWSDHRVECRVVNCGEPPDVAHAVKEYTDMVIGSEVEYICELGYGHSFSSFKVCQEDGVWSTDLVECLSWQTRFCIAPSEDPYATVSFSSLVAGNATATFTCVPGYTGSVASYTKLCGQDMQWRSLHPITLNACAKVSCGNPPEVNHAMKIVTGTSFNSTAKYTCRDGFRRSGPYFLTCHENGQWESVKIECIPENDLKCVEPVNPKNSKVSVNSYTVGGEAFITCIEGYTGGGTGLCSERGQWQWKMNACLPVDCQHPPYVTDARLNYTETHFGAVAVYECRRENYRQTGPYRSRCSKDSTWTHPSSTCQSLHECSAMPVSKTANFVTDQDQEGIFLTYTCKKNYVPSSREPRIRCLDTGQWPRDQANCQPIGMCASPPEIPNASLQEVHALPSVEEPNIFSAVYTCQEGFALDQSNPNDVSTFQLLCDNSTQWLPFQWHCLPVECPSPHDSPLILTGIPFTVQVSKTTYMSEAHISCVPPQVGDSTSFCQANGEWSTVNLRCVLPCNEPPKIANGSLSKSPVSESGQTDNSQPVPSDINGILGSKLQFPGGVKPNIPESYLSPITDGDSMDVQDSPHGETTADTRQSPEFWTVTCDEGFTYLGSENVTCSWNSTRQADQWEGVKEGMCVQVLYTNQSSELVIDTHVEKVTYFEALEICVNGTYQPSDQERIVGALYEGKRQGPSYYGIRLLVEPTHSRALVQDRRRKTSFQTHSTMAFNATAGQDVSFCLKVDYEMAGYSATLFGKGFDKYPPRTSFEVTHSSQFFVSGDIDIDQVKLTYFKT